MAARLTDKQRKKIIADYVEMGSYNAVAKKYKISATTVKKVVQNDPESAKKCAQKKEQNTNDILAHMERKKEKVNEVIDTYLDKMIDPYTMSKANPQQLATALGILIDKFTAAKVINEEQEREDDPLTKALKEEAERMQNEDTE